MRHGRAKQARRTLQFFERSAGIRPPYNVLIDGTFLIAALKFKVPLEDRLSKLLQQSQFRLCFLSGTLNELHGIKSQSKESSLFEEAIRFLRSHCERLEPTNDALPITKTRSSEQLCGAAADIYRFVAKHNEQPGPPTYIVASQDEELLASFREGVLVPLVRLAHNTVLLLERPSKPIQQHRMESERQVESVFETTQEPSRSTHTNDATGERKRGKAKGPNPLSCKKKKRKVEQQEQKPDDSEVKKRRRRRKRKEADGVDSGSDKEE